LDKNTHIHTDDVVVQYLLGALSAEETERLDELAIADDEFACRLQLVENDLVDAYVTGELSGPTLARFTSYYLASSKRRDKVRFAQVFHAAPDLDVLAPKPERLQRERSRQSFADEPRSHWGWLRGLFGNPRPALLWGTASIALVLVVVGLVAENRRLRGEIGQIQQERSSIQQRDRDQLDEQRLEAAEKEKELADLRDKVARLDQRRPSESPMGQPSVSPENLMVVPVDLAPQTRGISRFSPVSVPAAADLVTMQLELESGDYPAYRAELKALSGGRVVWSAGRLKPRTRDGGKVVVVNLRARLLTPQRYVLEVSGIPASGAPEIVGTYPFEVKKD
jgi:hypothetical protein